MTPKEKAEELVDKFMPHSSGNSNNNEAKECALIAVDEVIKTLPKSKYLEDRLEMVENIELIYWIEVKQEIEKL